MIVWAWKASIFTFWYGIFSLLLMASLGLTLLLIALTVSLWIPDTLYKDSKKVSKND